MSEPAMDVVTPPAPGPLLGLISPEVGAVAAIYDGMTGWTPPRLHTAYATVCDTTPIFGAPFEPRAGGISARRRPARDAALGEAVERYSAAYAPPSRLRRARAVELTGAAHPALTDLALWSPQQTGPNRRNIGHDLVVHWVRGTELGTGRPAWLPAHRVFLSDVDAELGLPDVTSTGLACHPEPWHALRSALLEAVERDAVMVGWSTRIAGVPVCWEPVDPAGRRLREQFDRAEERYQLTVLPSPTGIPVVFAVAFGGPDQPAAAVGASARLDLDLACRRALTEARQTFEWATVIRATGQPPLSAAEVRQLDDHVRYYIPPDRLEAFDFLRPTGAPTPVTGEATDAGRADADAAADVREIVGRLAAAGLGSYACDVTTPDVRSCGGWVVRALVPGLYPLTVGHGEHFLAHPRLAGVDVNPDPHPFP